MKKIISLIFVIVFILLCGFFVYITTPEMWPEYAEAEDLVVKIEKFRTTYSRLPENMKEIAPEYREQEGPVYYEKTDKDSYRVSFGLATLGESCVYYSETGQWH